MDSEGEIDIEEGPDFSLHSSDSDKPGEMSNADNALDSEEPADNSDAERPSLDCVLKTFPGDYHNTDSDLDEANPVHYRSLAMRTATKETAVYLAHNGSHFTCGHAIILRTRLQTLAHLFKNHTGMRRRGW